MQQFWAQLNLLLQLGEQAMGVTEAITCNKSGNRTVTSVSGIVYYERKIIVNGMVNAVRERLIQVGPEMRLWGN